MSPRLSCFSCEHYRRDGCVHGLEGWPEAGEGCKRFEYQPGTDEHKTCPMWQADVTSARTREEAWEVIQRAPAEFRTRLTHHAQTVFGIRRYYDRKSAEGRK